MRRHNKCRVCGCEDLTPYLDLGMMPLSNNLTDTPDDPERFPLTVAFCPECYLSQLTVVIPPEKMFANYVYRSDINAPYLHHCREMAQHLQHRYGLTKESFHIDIAGNDGALISQFKEVIGRWSLNIDPAANLVPINEAKGIRQYAAFWGADVARHLVDTNWPPADLITATNVFAHVDDVREFLWACDWVLRKTTGVLVLEFPYLMNTIEQNQFDQVYFEHLSYFLIAPLDRLCREVGFNIMDIVPVDIHGGSVQVHIGYGERAPVVNAWIRAEQLEGLHSIQRYVEWSDKVKEVATSFMLRISGYDNVAAFAASAKGNTLLNFSGVDCNNIQYIVDETPEKIGKYSPGTGIRIVDMLTLKEHPVDYLVVLSWNFIDTIMDKCRAAGYTGKFIHPLTGEVFG